MSLLVGLFLSLFTLISCSSFDKAWAPPKKDLFSELGTLDEDKVPKDDHLIAPLKKSCLKSNAHSCNALGRQLGNQNPTYAMAFFAISCNLNNAFGCYRAGLFHGKKGKMVLAGSYFEKGCTLGNGQSCFEIANKKEQEMGFNKAFTLFRKACHKGATDACKRLAFYFYDGKKDQKALSYFKKACDLKDHGACFNIGVIHHDQKRSQKALAFFSGACDLGSTKGCRNSAAMYSLLNKRHKSYSELIKAKELGFDAWEEIDKGPDFANLRKYRRYKLLVK